MATGIATATAAAMEMGAATAMGAAMTDLVFARLPG
jgi:hypothetical protein